MKGGVAVALIPAKPSHLTEVAGFVAYLHYNKAERVERVSSLRVAFSCSTECGDMSLMLLLLHSRLDEYFQVLGGLAVCLWAVPAVNTGMLLPLRQSALRNPPHDADHWNDWKMRSYQQARRVSGRNSSRVVLTTDRSYSPRKFF